MDFEELARRFMQSTHRMRSEGPPKPFDGTLQGEMFALSYLLRQGGTLVPGDISAEMKISSARVAAILKNLENKGFVSRAIDPSDRRRVLVSLTDDGAEHIKGHHKFVFEKIKKMLENLGEVDAKEFVRILERLADSEKD